VTRAFSRTERLLLRFGALGDPAAPPKVAVRLLNRAGEFIAALPAPTPLADGRFESQVVLSGLPPGDYLVELAAAVGEQSVRTLLALRVSGCRRPACPRRPRAAPEPCGRLTRLFLHQLRFD
jgi:hypothetical protein